MKHNSTYITSILVCILTIGFIKSASAQCPYDNTAYLQGAAPTTVGSSIFAPQTWGGDFNRVTNMIAGYTYEISSCSTPTFDSEITVYPAGGGAALGYDDDGCGFVSGPSKILFTPAVTGDYDFLLDEFPCATNNIDMTVEFKLISTGGGSGGASVTIPVVVHVVYKNASENVSDAQIQSQLQALNRDYRKLNADFSNTPVVFQSLGADVDIDFCLATFDPNGNSTTGITRTSTTVSSFDINTPPKFTINGGHDNWDPTRYLNLWVCDLTGNLLGFATFPADLATAPQLDGVAIDYQYFGTIGATPPFELGRTATHEVGHWLNLRHIWGDAFCGDDFVSDTPTQETSNGGCPSFPHVTCSNGPNGDLFMNYMDYVDDACMFLFTNGQKLRTDATLANIRNLLATSNGCGPTAINDYNNTTLNFYVYPNPASGQVTISLPALATKKASIVVCNLIGDELTNMNSELAVNGKMNLDLSRFPKGIYMVRLITPDGTNTQKLVLQ